MNCVVVMAVVSKILYCHDPEADEPGCADSQQLPEDMRTLKSLDTA